MYAQSTGCRHTLTDLQLRMRAYGKAGYRRAYLWLVTHNIVRPYGKKILTSQEGNALIEDLIHTAQPLMVARMGSTELGCLNWYLFHRPTGDGYPQAFVDEVRCHSGIAFDTDEAFDAFAEIYLDSIRQVDVMAVWLRPQEDYVVKHYCPAARVVRFRSLEPYYWQRPWSAALRGKRVLVVHPFVESIKRQYAQARDHLFANPNVLPEFELLTVKAVQSLGQRHTAAAWFQALDSMKAQIERHDFDLAILGAGAYGLPLTAHVKRMGKMALYLGGATQILFGIRGNRWENRPFFAQLFNSYWVRPLPSEVPESVRAQNPDYW